MHRYCDYRNKSVNTPETYSHLNGKYTGNDEENNNNDEDGDGDNLLTIYLCISYYFLPPFTSIYLTFPSLSLSFIWPDCLSVYSLVTLFFTFSLSPTHSLSLSLSLSLSISLSLSHSFGQTVSQSILLLHSSSHFLSLPLTLSLSLALSLSLSLSLSLYLYTARFFISSEFLFRYSISIHFHSQFSSFQHHD